MNDIDSHLDSLGLWQGNIKDSSLSAIFANFSRSICKKNNASLIFFMPWSRKAVQKLFFLG